MVTLDTEDAWLAAVGVRFLAELESEGATLLEEFEPRALAQRLRRKLSPASRAHLDYVVESLFKWRTIETDYEGEMPWDPQEPWTGPSYNPGPTRRTLERAITERADVEMDYFAHGRGEFTTRRVTPREIDGRYLVGFCHLRKSERTFRIERIARIRLVKSKKR